ncbi:MAG TPA: VOC family protein [Hyphomicrobiaceae bacterium]|jgi:uncharacterized glyoxalase superfamily protein PhnB|nr:VOC family protein [Hyphomicrobiaceae bacterium]
MRTHTGEPGSTLVPTLRYRDVPAAIDWLCRAFGFEKNLVVRDDDGTVRYAQLTFGSGMVMLGPVQDSEFDDLMRQPDEIGGVETQICYFCVEDALAHYARASEAGADMILDIDEDADGSGRGYSCRDLEGHIWIFGTYNPWRTHAVEQRPRPRASGLKRLASAAVLCALVAAGAAAWRDGGLAEVLGQFQALAAPAQPGLELNAVRDQLARERSAREELVRAAQDIKAELERERKARHEAETAAEQARAELAKERETKVAAARPDATATIQPRPDTDAKARLAHLETALRAAEQARHDAKAKLAGERAAREAAEHAAQEAREELAKERKDRAAADRLRRIRRQNWIRRRHEQRLAEERRLYRLSHPLEPW